MSKIMAFVLLCVGMAFLVCSVMFWQGTWASLIAGASAPRKDVDEKEARKATRYASIVTFAAGSAMVYFVGIETVAEFGFLETGFDVNAVTQVVFGFIADVTVIGLVSNKIGRKG